MVSVIGLPPSPAAYLTQREVVFAWMAYFSLTGVKRRPSLTKVQMVTKLCRPTVAKYRSEWEIEIKPDYLNEPGGKSVA